MRHQPPSPSPQLVRSRSGSSATSARATSPAFSSTNSQRFSNNYRSKSTTKSRTPQDTKGKITTPTPNIPSGQYKRTKESFASKLLPRAAAGSAWALSPGRSLQLWGNNSAASVGPTGKGVSGVWRYFRQKKVSPMQEEEFHRFRVLHNVLLQWRFANARAYLANAATNTTAQRRLFSVWLRTYKMRNSIVDKRIQVQRLKYEIKLYQILNPQILVLTEWSKLDRVNQESMAKLMSTLSSISIRLPLTHGAKADIMSMYEVMSEAIEAMDGIEETITRFFTQVERILYMVTELLITNKQHKENIEELENYFNYIAVLMDRETSIRSHCIQASLDSGITVYAKNY